MPPPLEVDGAGAETWRAVAALSADVSIGVVGLVGHGRAQLIDDPAVVGGL